MPAASPLHGIRVVDVTTSVAGPYCTLILGALGADIVKVERPDGGDDTRAWGPPFWKGESAMYLAVNANKRSVVLDLKSDDGRRALLELVRTADVFVQNLRPGVAERLGLGFPQLRRTNDRLIYCSIGAFGSTGPRSSEPGYDPLMQAAGGIMSVTGEAAGPPVRAGVSVVDQATGMWAVIAILAALRSRDEGAGAQLIETALFETAVNWLPYQIVGYLATGSVPGRYGSGIAIVAPYEAFETADGQVMIAAANDRLFAGMCEALDCLGLLEDTRFTTNPDRVANRGALRELIDDTLRVMPTSEALARLYRAGVPAASVQDVGEVVADPQTEALGLLQAIEHPLIDDLRLVALPMAINGQRVLHRSAPPLHGQHTTEGRRGDFS